MEHSANFREDYQGKMHSFLNYRRILLFIILFGAAIFEEVKSVRVRPVRRGRQDEDFSDYGNTTGQAILLKRQDYSAAQGLLEKQNPFVLLVSEHYERPRRRHSRRKLTQEEHIKFTAPQIIVAHGYSFKEHTVETEDGYLLTLFQMWDPNCIMNPNKAPILFMHGILDSADTWLVLDESDGAPYKSAHEGYDVWLGNARGNHYSNKHKTLSTKDPKYWDFSWHEMGTKDLPAMFDYILADTKATNLRQTINYVGHSMGTTMFYVCMSIYPQYNKIIDMYVALPPSAYLTETTSPFGTLLKPYATLYNTVLIDGPFLFSEINHLVQKTLVTLCPRNFSIGNLTNESICNFLAYLGQGNSESDIDSKILQRVFGHFPTTTSKKTVAHFLQLVGEDRFTQFDYGSPLKNFKRYGQTFPPSYNLYNVEVNSLSYYGQQDLLIDHKDSEKTLSRLGTLNTKYNVLVMVYSHLDYVWGNSAPVGIYSRFLLGIYQFYQSKWNTTTLTRLTLERSRVKKREKNLTGVRSCVCSCVGDKCYEDFDDPEPENEKYQRVATGGSNSDYDW